MGIRLGLGHGCSGVAPVTVLGVVLVLPVVWLLLSTAALIAVGRAWSAGLSSVERS